MIKDFKQFKTNKELYKGNVIKLEAKFSGCDFTYKVLSEIKMWNT